MYNKYGQTGIVASFPPPTYSLPEPSFPSITGVSATVTVTLKPELDCKVYGVIKFYLKVEPEVILGLKWPGAAGCSTGIEIKGTLGCTWNIGMEKVTAKTFLTPMGKGGEGAGRRKRGGQIGEGSVFQGGRTHRQPHRRRGPGRNNSAMNQQSYRSRGQAS